MGGGPSGADRIGHSLEEEEEKEEEEDGEEEEEAGFDIKSNNPNLKGGEQPWVITRPKKGLPHKRPEAKNTMKQTTYKQNKEFPKIPKNNQKY